MEKIQKLLARAGFLDANDSEIGTTWGVRTHEAYQEAFRQYMTVEDFGGSPGAFRVSGRKQPETLDTRLEERLMQRVADIEEGKLRELLLNLRDNHADDESLWTQDGEVKVAVLEERLGFHVSASKRDEVWDTLPSQE